MRLKTVETGPVYSKPLKCLGCNLTTQFLLIPNIDPTKEAWACTTSGCFYVYKSRFWKVRKAREKKVINPEALALAD